MAKLTARKYSYTGGQWNVNTVAMGGLGKDPELTGGVEQTGQCMFYAYQLHDFTCDLLSCRTV